MACELIHRRLKSRKELDDVSTAIRSNLHSVSRQYSNTRRVYSILYDEVQSLSSFSLNDVVIPSSSSISTNIGTGGLSSAQPSVGSMTSMYHPTGSSSIVLPGFTSSLQSMKGYGSNGGFGSPSVAQTPMNPSNSSSSTPFMDTTTPSVSTGTPMLISPSTNLSSMLPSSSHDTLLSVNYATAWSGNLTRDSMVIFIAKRFMLSPDLARKYVAITFLQYAKFNMSKIRGYQQLPCTS